MNINQLIELFTYISTFGVLESEYLRETIDTRLNPPSEYIVKKFLESLGGFSVIKKNHRYYDYDFDVTLDCIKVFLEIKQIIENNYNPNGQYNIKLFTKLTRLNDRKRYQGIHWDLSSQLNNPNGKQLTAFFRFIKKNGIMKLILITVLDNKTIINSTKIDKSLDQFGNKPLGLLTFPQN